MAGGTTSPFFQAKGCKWQRFKFKVAAVPHPKNHYLKSFDGTKICYQTIGDGKRPMMVLANGLGGASLTWQSLYEALADRFRFLCWDYRGLFHSDPPADETFLKIEDHARDLEVILAKERVDRFLIAGWSMGVQVALEAYRSLGDRMQGMILLNGTYGNPFHSAFSSPLSKLILPRLNELMQKIGPTLQSAVRPLLGRVIKWQDVAMRLRQLGLTAQTFDSGLFEKIAKGFATLDLRLYHEIMKHLSEHSAEDMLPQLKVPVLILAGDADVLTPPAVTDVMMKKIPQAELFIIPRGTHFALLEYPEIITMRVNKWLQDRCPDV